MTPKELLINMTQTLLPLAAPHVPKGSTPEAVVDQWLQAIVEKHKMIKRDDARAESDIRIREKLSSAEAERIKGMAEMYKNSGYRIDYKVDADSFPEINKVQSVFSQ